MSRFPRWPALPLALLLCLLVPGAASAQDTAALRRLRGVVRDSLSGRPLESVQFTVGGTVTSSDAAGRFELVVAADTVRVTVRRIGYEPRTLPAAAIAGELRLAPSPVLLTTLTAEAEAPNPLARGTALTVDVAPRESFSEQAAVSVGEALAGREGISASRPGVWGVKTVLRGLSAERVTVLLDGSRLNRACTFGMDGGVSTIDPSSVERVEVLTGPGSTLYGSGNMGGVINVVTRAAPAGRPVAGELRAFASSAIPGGKLGGTLWLAQGIVEASVSADGSSFGDYQAPSGTVAGSSYRDATVELKAAVRPAAGHRLAFAGQRYFGRDIGYPGSNATIPEEDRLSLSLDYGWQLGRFVDAFSARAYVQRLDHDMTVTMTSTMPNGSTMTMVTDAVSRSTTSGGRAQVRLLPASAVFMDAGVEVTQWAAEATRWTERQPAMGPSSTIELNTWPAVRLLDAGAFAQGEVRVAPALVASAGGRVDYTHRQADGWPTTDEWIGTGNVGVRAELPAGFALRGVLGYGYRVPDPTELFGLALRPDGFLYRGNPDVQTETSRNLEFTASWGRRDIELSGTVFRNDLAGMISTVATGDTVVGRPVREYANLADARITGASGRVQVRPLRYLRVTGSATYTYGQNEADGSPLPAIPPLEIRGEARVEPGTGLEFVGVEAHGATAQDRAAVALGEVTTPGWAVVHLRAGLRVNRTRVAFGIENLLDESYRTHLDAVRITNPGRNFYLRVTQSL